MGCHVEVKELSSVSRGPFVHAALGLDSEKVPESQYRVLRLVRRPQYMYVTFNPTRRCRIYG